MGNLDNYLIPTGPAPADMQINSPYCVMHRAGGYLATKTVAMVGVSAAASYDLFNFTGLIQIKEIWGVFTDVTNVTAITAASFDVDDGAATEPLTSPAGTVLSGATLDSSIAKLGGAAVALDFAKADQVRVSENAVGPKLFTAAELTPKSTTTCQIRFTCTTGAVEDFEIQFWCAWVCKQTGSTLVPA